MKSGASQVDGWGRGDTLRRAESFSRVVELISGELALEPLLTRIIEAAADLIGATSGAIHLVRERPGGPVVQRVAGLNLPPNVMGQEQRPGMGLAGTVLVARAPVRLDRYGDLDRPALPEMAESAVIGMPIWSKQRIVGVFSVGAPPPRRFTEDDVETLVLFARHAGIAIENARLFEAEQRQVERAELLYRTSRRISTAMTVEEVMAAYLEAVSAGGPYTSTVGIFEDGGQGPSVRAVQGHRAADGRMRLTEVRLPREMFDGLHHLLEAGETVIVEDVRSDPRVSEIFRREQARVERPSFALIPLVAQSRCLGVVALSRPHVGEWVEADLRPYQVTAAQLAAAIDSRRQHELLVERGHQLAALEERRRLARELHDSVTQTLFSISLMAQVVPELWEVDRPRARHALDQVRDLTRAALSEMRALLVELRSTGDEPRSLAWTLERHAAGFEERTGLPVARELDESVEVPDAVGHALARIVQEALANIARHASARSVSLRLLGDRPVRLEIADDGHGFDPRAVGEGHFGLISMQERAAGIEAQFVLRSTPGEGTRIAVEWPGGEQGGA